MHITTDRTTGRPANEPGFWRRFLPVWSIGLVGVLTLLVQPVPQELLAGTASDEMPELALRLLLLVNPLVLLTVLCAAGAATAHRAGLSSMMAGTSRVMPIHAWASAVAGGLVLAAGIFLVDILWAPHLSAAWEEILRRSNRDTSVRTLLLGIGYGGLAEEVMMRWGLMSVVAWVLAKTTGALGSGRTAPAWAIVAAALVSAVIFAAGHLPALAQISDPTAALVARTLALNVAAGLF